MYPSRIDMMSKSLSPWLSIGLILGLLLSSSIMADDSQGPFVRMIRHKDGSRTVTAHHTGMQTQEVVTYDADNVVRLKRINHLDTYGRPQSFEFYDGNNKMLMRGKFTFDSQNRMKEELLYTVDGQLIRRLTKNYDITGRELPPTVTGGNASVPQAILQWSDPDGEGTGTLSSNTNPSRSGNGNQGQSNSETKPKRKFGLPFGLGKKDKR